MMRTRYLQSALDELAFSDGKMAFVSGPRQCGKTTLAKNLLKEREAGRYLNWDDVEFRRAWARAPKSLVPLFEGARPLMVLDEIHKDRRWKSALKGVYDTLELPCDILVTGSARLGLYHKGGDSLLGRYRHFRLHPFSLRELRTPVPSPPDSLLEGLFLGGDETAPATGNEVDDLMALGPFPEPLLSGSERKARIWRRQRRELIIREDLRDLSRIPDLARIEMMAALLPERVGSPLSLNALRETLEVSYDAVKRWLRHLEDLYYLFPVRPWHRSIARSLKKEAKVYFWDFSEVEAEGARFENLVAVHLLKACHYWTDTGEGSFDLWYLRDKEKREIDFLVTRDGKPWLPVEAKWRETAPSAHWRAFLPALECGRGVQVVGTPCHRLHSLASGDVLVTGAGTFLSRLV